MSRQVLGESRWESVAFASGMLSPLQDHAVAYDPDEDTIAIAGGRESNDTLAPSTRWHAADVGRLRAWSFRAAERLFGATAVYDPGLPRLLVFGGLTNAGRASSDLLQIDLRDGLERYAFSTVKPAGQRPPGRYHHAAAFDPERGWLVVYGGVTGEDQALSEGRTWIYDARADRWAPIDGAWVGERVGAVMVYDARHRTVVLAGGSKRGPRDATGDIHFLACAEAPSPTPETAPTDGTPSAIPTTAGATATPTPPVTDAPPTTTPTKTSSPAPSRTTQPAPVDTLEPSPDPTAIGTPTPVPKPVHLPSAHRGD